jgi:hypothetical protein
MSLLLLAPDFQEEILGGGTARAKPVAKRRVSAVVMVLWEHQRRVWGPTLTYLNGGTSKRSCDSQADVADEENPLLGEVWKRDVPGSRPVADDRVCIQHARIHDPSSDGPVFLAAFDQSIQLLWQSFRTGRQLSSEIGRKASRSI